MNNFLCVFLWISLGSTKNSYGRPTDSTSLMYASHVWVATCLWCKSPPFTCLTFSKLLWNFLFCSYCQHFHIKLVVLSYSPMFHKGSRSKLLWDGSRGHHFNLSSEVVVVFQIPLSTPNKKNIFMSRMKSSINISNAKLIIATILSMMCHWSSNITITIISSSVLS